MLRRKTSLTRRRDDAPLMWRNWRGGVAVALQAPSLLRLGWHEPPVDPAVLHGVQIALLALYAVMFLLDARRVATLAPKMLSEYRKVTRPERFLLLTAAVLCWWQPALAACVLLLALVYVVRTYLRLVQMNIPPGLVFLGSFVVLSVVGSAALKLPAATPPDQPISWTDSTFTIVSAVSQTGLVVRPTGEGFTRFGQTIIMIWIQVGALGVIVFGAMLANLFGARFGLRATQTMGESTEQGWSGQLSTQKLVTFIIVFTHAVELVGAVIIFFSWPDEWPGMPDDFQTTADRAFHSVFFSVSGFCNAGFVTTSDSMESLRGHFLPHLILAPMIVLGSIGFPVLDNLWRVFKAKLRGQHVEGRRGVVGGTSESGRLIRLELNTKIILATTAFAYVLGYVLIFLGEMFQTNEPLRLIALDAHFMNINRTSGFNTIPPDEMGLLSRLVLIFLMFLGGSPASLAGGIKLMVFAVLALTVFATIRGRRETTAFGRTIPDAVVRKSAALIVLCLTIVLAVTGVLAVSERGGMGEDGPALDVLLFEATSAFGTTGLSLGITDELSPVGRWTIIVAMFLGRVGILAAVAALVSVAAVRRPRTAYPSGEVVVY